MLVDGVNGECTAIKVKIDGARWQRKKCFEELNYSKMDR